MRDAGGECAQRIHLLTVQQFAAGDFQFTGAFRHFLFHFGVAANQLAVAVKRQAGKEEREGDADHRD